MKLGKSKNITIIVGSFLLATVMALLVMLASIEPTIAQASTAGTRMSSGIDYSGQGTIVNEEIRIGTEATVSGSYLNIPTWKKGAFVYNTWDEFWAGWSSWSTDNSKFFGYKGYNYNNQYYIKDTEKKTEYKWYREWSKKRDVYSTKYYRQYKGKHIFHWGHKDSSWNGYPSNKGCCSSTIYTKSEKRGTQSYVEREESGYAFSAPFRWAWDPQWKSFAPRDTYRVKKVNLNWDEQFKYESTESVPLNYSLYHRNGEALNLGIKLDINRDISEQDNREWYQKMLLPIKFENCYDVNQYYLNIDAIALQISTGLTDSANNGDSIAEYIVGNGTKYLWSGIGSALKLFGKQAVFKTLGGYMIGAQIVLTGVDALMQHLKKESINDFNNVLKSIDNDDKILMIQETTYQDLNSQTGSFPITSMKMIVLDEDIQNVSLKYDATRANKYGLYNYSNQNYYGKASYIKTANEVNNVIKSYLDSFNIFSWASFIPA